jgi:hypothetical protein
MAIVRGRPLTFEPFLKLPHLKELVLQGCEVTESFEVAGHPALEVLHFQGSSPRHITVCDMPMLSHFAVTNADQSETAKLIDCPALESCCCTATQRLGKLDLREANAAADVDTTISQRGDAVLLPDWDKEQGAEEAP